MKPIVVYIEADSARLLEQTRALNEEGFAVMGLLGVDDALQLLQHRPQPLILLSTDLPPADIARFFTACQASESLSEAKVIGVIGSDEHGGAVFEGQFTDIMPFNLVKSKLAQKVQKYSASTG